MRFGNRRRRKLLQLAIAAAMASTAISGLPVRAATYTWIGGASGDATDFQNAANWLGGAVPGSTDIAYFNTGYVNQAPTLTTDSTIGELQFNTAGWQLSGGAAPPFTLTLNGLAGIGIRNNAAGGTNEISANLNLAAAQTWQLVGGTLQLDGVLSGNSALNLTGNTTVLSTAANTYSGALTVSGGTFELASNGTLQSVQTITINTGGRFFIDNGVDGTVSDRLSAPALNLAGGWFYYIAHAPASATDTVGAITLGSGATSVLTVDGNSGASGSMSAVLNATSVAQSAYAGTNGSVYTGSLLVNGTNLGLAVGTTANPNSSALLLTYGPTGIGNTPGTSSENSANLDTQVVPFLLGEISTGPNGAPCPAGVGGTAFNTANTFLTTYSANDGTATGLRPLNPVDEFAHSINDGTDTAVVTTGSISGTGDNVYLTAAQTTATLAPSSTAYINSLVLNGAGADTTPTLTIPDGTTLGVNSGTLLFVTNGAIQPSSATGALAFGTNDVNITVDAANSAVATISAPVTGTGASMTIAGGGTVQLQAANTFSNSVLADGSKVVFGNGTSGGWTPPAATPFAVDALVVTGNGSATFDGTSTITTDTTSNYLVNVVAGTMTVTSGSALNLTVQGDGSSGNYQKVEANFGSNSTLTNNGTLTMTGQTRLFFGTGSVVNNSGGTMNFNPAAASSTGDYVSIAPYNGVTFNIGNLSGTGTPSFNVSDLAGMAVIPGASGAVSYWNVYRKAQFNVGQTNFANGTTELRFGADTAGAEVMNLYGSATIYSLLLGDNSTGTAAPNILGAIYMQQGSTLNITDVTVASGNSYAGIFSIGSAGAAPPSPTTGGNAANNDFGYVSVPTGATIGATSAPGEIDIGGEFRTSSTVGGGNGILDVMGGTVYAGGVVMSGSNQDQQLSELNMVGGTLNLNPSPAGKGSGASVLTMAGTSTGATAGVYGAYSALNLLNGSTINTTGTNYALNVAGSSGGGTGQNPHAAYLMPTGIVTLSGGSNMTFGYIRGGEVSIGGTPTSTNTTVYTTTADGFINFNKGTLTDNGGSTLFIQPALAGLYVYSGGATISGPGNSNAINTNMGFYAPPGEGIPTGTVSVTNGGSGYLTPPEVVISDPTGFDAAGYATINSSGQVTGVVITNPGFNMSNPILQLVGGGGSGASVTVPTLVSNASGPLTIAVSPGTTFNLNQPSNGNASGNNGNGMFGGSSGNNASGNTTQSAIYSITNSNGADNYNLTGTSNTLGVDTSGQELGSNPYANGTFYGQVYPGIRNNTSTYTGPTVVQTGTLALIDTASSATNDNVNNYAVGAFAATNNNIPFSSVVIVGDVSRNSAAVLNVTQVLGAGGFQLAPGLMNTSTVNGTPYSYQTNPQVLSGFGTVVGSSAVGVTVGLASGQATADAPVTTAGGTTTANTVTSTGNNFGGYPYAGSGTWTPAPSNNNSVIAPGYTTLASVPAYTGTPSAYNGSDPVYGAIVLGTGTGSSGTPVGAQAFTFNTQYGGAPADLAGIAPRPTGRLTISETTTGSGVSATNAMTTTLGAGGIYYWKLNLGTAGAAGAASTGGTQSSTGASTSGAAWDALVMDAVTAGTATNSTPFTVEAYGFNLAGQQPSPVTIGNGNTQNYSWAIARTLYVNNGTGLVAATPSTLAPLLADLSLNTNGLPKAANGYEYFLNAQSDPSGGADIVINYAPAPEPTSLALLGLGASTMLIRRRRKLAGADLAANR